MRTIFQIFMGAFMQIILGTSQLATAISQHNQLYPVTASYTVAAIVSSTILIGGALCIFAVVERIRRIAARHQAAERIAGAEAEIRFREAVISACPEAIAILGRDLSNPTSYRGGGALLQACLEGPDAAALAARLDDLIKRGESFRLRTRTASFPVVSIRGCPVGSRAAVFLQPDENTEPDVDFRAVLDRVPLPVWIRNSHQVLTWVNQAFLAASGQPTLRDALLSDASLDRCERDLARAASDGVEIENTRRYVIIGSQRKALSLNMRRLPDAGVAGFAVDVTETARAEASLKLQHDTFSDLLDHLGHAVAVFDAESRLALWNKAFATLWGLPEPWLSSKPTLGQLLDNLREARRLPEQRDFAGWKRELLQLFAERTPALGEIWHEPNGASVEVKAFPYLGGGVAFVFADVSERYRNNAAYNMLLRSQRAMLDTIGDAMASFGTDGRLKLFNNAFVRMWNLREDDLSGEPHISAVAQLCKEHVGAETVWSQVYAAISSLEPFQNEHWGEVHGSDGRTYTMSMVRLPSGGPLLNFADITDLSRFQSVVKENISAA